MPDSVEKAIERAINPRSVRADPPRQNSCRLDMILNLGAIRMKYGTVRRSIQEQGGGAVVSMALAFDHTDMPMLSTLNQTTRTTTPTYRHDLRSSTAA